MRYRRKFHSHDTAELPDIEMWVDQPNVVPVAASEEAAWTLQGAITVDSADGFIRAVDVAQNSYAERAIAGLIEGHVYKVTITFSGGDVIDISVGGVTLGTDVAEGTYVYYVRPVTGSVVRFDYTKVPAGSFNIEAVATEAMEGIDFDLLRIKPF